MGELPLEKKVDGSLPYLVKAGLIADPPDAATRDYVRRVVVALGERLKVFSDILDARNFFVADDRIEYDEAAFNKHLGVDGVLERQQRFRARLATVRPFEPQVIEETLRAFVESEGIKMGDIIHGIRVAVTGKPTGPGLFDCLALLGRERCLARIDRALSRTRNERE